MIKYFFAVVMMFQFYNLFAQSGYKMVNAFPVKSDGWWDYPAIHGDRLYVSHGTQVNILDKKTGDSLGVISGTLGVHGIAFNDALGRGYTSNGRLNNVFVFDLKTNKILDSIKTGINPDAIMFEPFTKMIITCNGRSDDLTLIDPKTNAVKTTITVPGKPETAVSDEEGKLFVNIEDKNEIAVVDLNAMKMIKTYALNGGEEPTGIVYDKKTKRLFTACDKVLVALDATTGKVLSKITIGEGCDGVAFDKENKMIFTANGGSATMTVVQEKSENEYAVIENVKTKAGARTITIDTATHTLYLPTAEFAPATGSNNRPQMLPGSFQILVVKRPD